jgi:hypothetical protein
MLSISHNLITVKHIVIIIIQIKDIQRPRWPTNKLAVVTLDHVTKLPDAMQNNRFLGFPRLPGESFCSFSVCWMVSCVANCTFVL